MPVVTHDTQGVMVNHHARLVYWPILKNAHTALDFWIRKAGFKADHMTTRFPGYTHFAVLRHPLPRYVSSLAQMWRQGIPGFIEWETFVDRVQAYNVDRRSVGGKLWTARGDLHFERQSSRLSEAVDPVLFRLGHVDKLWAWLDKKDCEVPGPMPVKNPTPGHQVKYALSVLDPDPVLAHYGVDVGMYEGAQ